MMHGNSNIKLLLCITFVINAIVLFSASYHYEWMNDCIQER